MNDLIPDDNINQIDQTSQGKEYQNLIIKGEFFSVRNDLCGKFFLLISFEEKKLQKGIVCVSNFTKRFKDDVKISLPWFDYLNILNFFVKDTGNTSENRFFTMKERIEEQFNSSINEEFIDNLLSNLTSTSNQNMQQFHLNEKIIKPLEEQISIDDLKVNISHELLEKEKKEEVITDTGTQSSNNNRKKEIGNDLLAGKTPVTVQPLIDPVQGKPVNDISIGDMICFKLSRSSDEYCCPVIGVSYSPETSRTQILAEINDEMVGVMILSPTTKIKIPAEQTLFSDSLQSDQLFILVSTALFILFAILIAVVWLYF